MRWETLTITLGYEVYELWHKEQKLLTLTFHPATSSARVETAGEKRVLQIRKEGFRRNKPVLRSEYGILIGQLGHENKEQTVELNNERFFYTIENKQEPDLVVYKDSKTHPLTVCRLNVNKSNLTADVSKKNTPLANLHSSLLLALCWYLFLPVSKESVLDYAV
ncbi:MAG: hypothetical protein ACHQEB_00940 [Chitinophagales bacterium]